MYDCFLFVELLNEAQLVIRVAHTWTRGAEKQQHSGICLYNTWVFDVQCLVRGAETGVFCGLQCVFSFTHLPTYFGIKS